MRGKQEYSQIGSSFKNKDTQPQVSSPVSYKKELYQCDIYTAYVMYMTYTINSHRRGALYKYKYITENNQKSQIRFKKTDR